MMCERAFSRHTQGTLLAEHQFVQGFIADSAIQLKQYRCSCCTPLDHRQPPHGAARTHIAMCKVAMARFARILERALHLHGSLGTTHETPLGEWWVYVPQLALADGPTEVHKVAVARGTLKKYTPAPGLFPTDHSPTRRAGGPGALCLRISGSFDPMTRSPAELFDLTGKVALVTGGSRGLGHEIALAFATAGADVVIASRKPDACEAIAEEVGHAAARLCRSPAMSAIGMRARPRRCRLRALRQGRHPGKQCGHVAARASSVETSRGAVRQGHRGDFKGLFRLSALIGAANDARRRGRDHQHLVDGRHSPPHRALVLMRAPRPRSTH